LLFFGEQTGSRSSDTSKRCHTLPACCEQKCGRERDASQKTHPTTTMTRTCPHPLWTHILPTRFHNRSTGMEPRNAVHPHPPKGPFPSYSYGPGGGWQLANIKCFVSRLEPRRGPGWEMECTLGDLTAVCKGKGMSFCDNQRRILFH